jgi:hypothetical protein
MSASHFLRASSLVALFLLAGCSGEAAPSSEADLTSNDGTVLDFAFEGEVLAPASTPARDAVVTQLQYVQGALTTDVQGNAQVGFVRLRDVKETVESGNRRIRYSALLPVVWPKAVKTPTSYTLALPRDIRALGAFNATYDGKCGKNEYGQATFWHDFNPKAADCVLGADASKSAVTVRPAAQATKGKYPEYAEMLKDDSVDVVAVFGIIKSNTNDDPGAQELDNVGFETARELTDVVRTEKNPGGSVLRVATVRGKFEVQGRKVSVNLTSLLVNDVSGAGADFDALYGPASANADLIIYSGHSGLGKNINALAEKTQVRKSKYQMLYLNGCQSFAYLGRTLHEKKIAVNGAAQDPFGTKYLDVVANALPAYGDYGLTGLRLYRAILKQATPQSYNDILKTFSRAHLVAAFGEEDNTFEPR